MEPPHASTPGLSQPQPNPPGRPAGSFMPAPPPFGLAPQGPFIQPPSARSSSSRAAFTQGLIFGLILAGVFLMVSFLLSRVLVTASGDTLLVLARGLLLPIQCVCYFLAGIFASLRTGITKTGMVASFWMNLWYLLSAIPIYFLLSTLLVQHSFVVYTIISLLIALGLGAGLGALGGLVGKALNKPKQPTAPFYPIQSYGGPQQGQR